MLFLFLALIAFLVLSAASASAQKLVEQSSLQIDPNNCPTFFYPPECFFSGDWTLEKWTDEILVIHPYQKPLSFEIKITENEVRKILKNHGTLVIVNNGQISAELTSIVLNLQLENITTQGGTGENSWTTVGSVIANAAELCNQSNIARTCFGDFTGSPGSRLILLDYLTGDPIDLGDVPAVPFTEKPICDNATKINFEGEFDITDAIFDEVDKIKYEILVTFNGRKTNPCTTDVNCNGIIDPDDPLTLLVNESEEGIRTVPQRREFSFPDCVDTMCTTAVFSDWGAFSSGEDCIELTSGSLLDTLTFLGLPGTEYNYMLDCTVSCHTRPCSTYVKNEATLEFIDCDLILSSTDSFAVRCTTIETGISEEELEKTVKDFALLGNYPNPFNPFTEISYYLAKDAKVKVEIYNLRGQKVITLLDRKQTRGLKKVQWDGKDHSGKRVSSGIYFYRVQANDKSETKKMTFIK